MAEAEFAGLDGNHRSTFSESLAARWSSTRKRPDKILTIIIVAGSAFRQVSTGSTGWAEDPQNGVREQSGAELAEAKRQADFYSPLNVHAALFEADLLPAQKR